jgi:hypothetical protein
MSGQNDIVTVKKLGEYLPLAGGKMTGDLDMDNHKITSLPDPTGTQQPVNLRYADAHYLNKVSGGTVGGEVKFEGTDGSNIARFKGNVMFKKKGQSIGGNNIFEITGETVKFLGNVDTDNSVATKKYVDERSTQAKVRIGTTTGFETVGDMWFNPNDNVYYIKKS